jgi:hypothetical protein
MSHARARAVDPRQTRMSRCQLRQGLVDKVHIVFPLRLVEVRQQCFADCGQCTRSADCGRCTPSADCGTCTPSADCGTCTPSADCGTCTPSADCGTCTPSADCGTCTPSADCGTCAHSADCGRCAHSAIRRGPERRAISTQPSTLCWCHHHHRSQCHFIQRTCGWRSPCEARRCEWWPEEKERGRQRRGTPNTSSLTIRSTQRIHQAHARLRTKRSHFLLTLIRVAEVAALLKVPCLRVECCVCQLVLTLVPVVTFACNKALTLSALLLYVSNVDTSMTTSRVLILIPLVLCP